MPAGSKPGERRGGRQKGSSNKVGKDVRDLARAYTARAVKVLADIMNDTKAPQQARAAAADKLLDRAWGKAPQAIVGDPDNPVQLKGKIELIIVDPNPKS